MPTCSLLLLLAAAGLYAQDSARDLLRRVSENYKQLDKYRFESITESELTGELHHSWSTSYETVAVSKPDKVRFEAKSDISWFQVVSDGKTMWRATPYTRRFVRTSFSGPFLDVKGGGALAEAALRNARFAMSRNEQLDRDLKSAQLMREETVEVGREPFECFVVRADYDAPPLASGIDSIVRTFWIDKKRLIVLQSETASRGRLAPQTPFEPRQTRHFTRFRVASIGSAPPDDLFTYVPPPGFNEVDKLEGAPNRGALSDLLGKTAPELASRTLDGKELILSSLRGKVVLLDFWATWCAPCRDQMPAVEKLYREADRQGLVLIGVNDDEAPETARDYMAKNRYLWPSIFDGLKHEARVRFQVDAIPALVVIDRQGTVVEYQIGSGRSAEAAVRAALRKLGFSLSE